MRYIPAVLVLLVSGLLGWYVLSPGHPIKLGLDLAGGTELIYRADTSLVQTDKQGALNALREVIERRVNLFGVAEPLVQLEQSSAVAGAVEDRLLVELPGVTDVQAAVDAIGATPSLEFRLGDAKGVVGEDGKVTVEQVFIPTELTGRYLEKADLQFGSQSGAATLQPQSQRAQSAPSPMPGLLAMPGECKARATPQARSRSASCGLINQCQRQSELIRLTG